MGSLIPCCCHGQGHKYHEKGAPGCIAHHLAAPVVGLYSSVMQSGKTSAASYLKSRHGYREVKFAGPLKKMLAPLFDELGLHPNSCTDGHLKEVALDDLGGKSPRLAMQRLGTEWGRNAIDPDLWVRIAARHIRGNTRAGWPVVVDDMRWPNEYDCIAGLPTGLLIKIVRPGEEPYSAHGSEGLLEDRTFDFTIINSSDIEALCRMVEDALARGYTQGARALGIKEVTIEP